MNTEQIIHRWRPHPEAMKYLALDYMKEAKLKTELVFCMIGDDRERMLKERSISFTFDNSLIALRYSDECHRSDLIYAKEEKHGIRPREKAWPYGIVENAEFVKWYLSQAAAYEAGELTTYMLVDECYVFEVISRAEPIVKVFDTNP